MLKILSEICNSNKKASIYTNEQETNKFHYGTILAVNDKEIAISMISPKGEFDGVSVIPTDFVYRIETDGQYSEKMEKLCSDMYYDKFDKELDTSKIKESLLDIAVQTQQIVSLELVDSGYYDVVGFVKEIKDGCCRIRVVDEYGAEDGDSFVMLDNITQVCYASEDENLILRLWKINKGL